MRAFPISVPGAFRASLDFVFVADDLEHAETVYGSVQDWAERVGCLPQGGIVQRMDDEDMVPGSPLADQLSAALQEADVTGKLTPSSLAQNPEVREP